MRVSSLCLLAVCLLASVLQCTCSPNHQNSEDEGPRRHKRAAHAPTLNDRTHCNPGDQWPSTRVNTTARLAALRAEMLAMSLDVFIIFSDDAHGSEYPADRDLRRGFISGFSGSAGYAAVTLTKAALWTDGRYFLEAEDALDCNWIFMRQGQPGVPSMSKWLTTELTAGQVIGADPFLVTNSLWKSLSDYWEKSNLTLRAVTSNPMDTVWTDQPPPPYTPINALDIKYAGRRWEDKVRDVHTAMEDKGIQGAYVVTSLDEVAWLFNLRASDIDYNPFFISYAVVEYYGNSSSSNKVRLYIQDKTNRLTGSPTDPESPSPLYQHLNTAPNGSCAGRTLAILAREPLYEIGVDYNHGTGHGIGAYFSVHEGPGFIGLSKRAFYAHEELRPNMFFSDEPGFYDPGQFGVRLETVVMVEPANTKYNFGGMKFLHFKPITLVPFEPKLIDYSLLSNHQISWLNHYHQLCQDNIEPLLTSDLAKTWLRERTKPYVTLTPKSAPAKPCNSAPPSLHTLSPLLLMLVAAALTWCF